MEKFDDITLGEIKELLQLFASAQPNNKQVKKSPHINKIVMIRAYGSGVHFGTLIDKTDTEAGIEVELHGSRRVHYWAGAASLSQLAMQGTKSPDNCRIACVVDEITITGVMEIIPLTERLSKICLR